MTELTQICGGYIVVGFTIFFLFVLFWAISKMLGE